MAAILKNQDSFIKAQSKNNTTNPPQDKADVSVYGERNLLSAAIKKGLVTEVDAENIKVESANTGKTNNEILVEKNILSPLQLVRLQAEMKGISFVDIASIAVKPDLLQKLPQQIAKDIIAVPFEETSSSIKVAMNDPLDLQKIKYIESVLGKHVDSYYALNTDIQRVIDTKYGAQIGNEVDEALEEVGGGRIDQQAINAAAQDSPDDAPIIKIVNMIMDYAIKNKASDVHVEPRDTKVSVRFRIRGVLSEKLSFPKSLSAAVIARIKILSDLKIDEHRIPQDGRFQINSANYPTDVRVSIMPSIYGEKIVMRILEKSKGILDLEKTGLFGSSYLRMKTALEKTQGIILVTGPTGSGKTQTLASSLKILNTNQVNIITLEDPVEIRIEGINQTQINPEVGLTFASGLRAVLRQDPDIIMVGEIRDSETATLAVQSALVGRLVLSTVHTNSAAGAFIRLIDMGIEPFLLTSTVNVVIGQRLVRTLSDSKEKYRASEDILQKFHEVLDPLGGVRVKNAEGVEVVFDQNTQALELYKAVPSPSSDSGYDSRTGIFEALKMSEEISSAIIRKSSISEIEAIAVKQGMISMLQDGYIKCIQGITTFEEVMRVRNE